MKFTIGILFTLFMTFNPVLSQANDDFDENLSFPSQLEEDDDPQQILESLEALVEDIANAVRTENGRRIVLSASSAVTLGALANGAEGAVARASAGDASRRAQPASLADDALNGAPIVPTPTPDPSADVPKTPTPDPPASATAMDGPHHWRSVILNDDSGMDMRGRFAQLADTDLDVSRLHVRQINRRGSHFLIAHPDNAPVNKGKSFLLRFRRDGYTVDIYECTNTKKLLSWFIGAFGSSCTRSQPINTKDISKRQGRFLGMLSEVDIPADKGYITRNTSGFFARLFRRKPPDGVLNEIPIGSGFFARWGRRLVVGSGVGIVLAGIYISYADDGQVTFVEVTDETLEVLQNLVVWMLEQVDNANVNGMLDDLNF